jgi:thiol-disulfide isomerase/thioredoxin
MKRIICFSGPDCPACEIAKPIVKAAAKKKGIRFDEIDACNEPMAAFAYDISVLPTFVLVDDDNLPINEIHGGVTNDLVNKFIASAQVSP